MINRVLAVITLLLVTIVAYCQDINGSQADSLRLVLDKTMPDTIRLDILFRLAEFYIVKPGDYKEDLDLAAGFLRKAELINENLHSEDVRGFCLVISSMLAKERKQEKQGKEMAEKAVDILRKSNNKYYLGKAFFGLSEYYRYTDRTELVEKIRLVELAVRYFSQSKDIATYANSVKHLADLYEINDQRSKVLENLNLSLKLYQSIHYPRLSGVYVLLNRYYYLRGNYKLAVDYCLMALKDAERARDSGLSYCQINNYMAITLVHLNKRERATGYYQTALQIAEKYKDNRAVLLVMNNMVRNYLDLKKPQDALVLMKSIPKELLVPTSEEDYILTSLCYASIYFELKKYTETGAYCNQILGEIKVRMPRAQVVNDFYQLLIRYYLQSKQYALAGTYLKKIDSLSRKLDDPARIQANYYLAFRLDTATGSTRSAIANLLKFQHLHDSLFDETSHRQMQQMEVEYETEKNKNEIKIRDQNIVMLNQLQQSDLQRAGLVRKFSIGGVGLLLVIIALLFYHYRNKQQINQTIMYKNELLEHLITEKEWLLKEVHHRVKNNLHTVICLLQSQAAYLEDDALKAIEDSQHRIFAMSLIHQKLYQAEDVKTIDMAVYLPEFVRYLDESFGSHYHVSFRLDIEPLLLGVSQAIPIALIINEAVTNSIKYAFPQNKNGVIEIMMHKNADQITLIIADNGVGIDESLLFAPSQSLGMKLINGLSADINASVNIKNDNGTKITIVFNVDPLYNNNPMPEIKEKEIYV